MFRLRIAVALVAVALLAAGCGKSNKVGDDSLVNFKDQANARLGSTTTTTAPPATTSTTAAQNKAGIQNTTTTTAKATTTTAVQAAIEITINGDQAGSGQFDPPVARVSLNSTVKWTNRDTVPRSVEADTGKFVSPSIPPGQSWTYKATAAGKFNYHDGTRPYAVASLEVVAR